MSTQVGFSETDITPPVGTHKIGWLKDLVSDRVLDPLFARIAVFDNGGERLGFVQLDTLSIRWTQTQEIRRRVEEACGVRGARVMVAATHNHAGPAVATTGEVKRDEAYVATMIEKIVSAFADAYERREWLADLATRLSALIRHLTESGAAPSTFAPLQRLVDAIEAGGDVDPIWDQAVAVLEAFTKGK